MENRDKMRAGMAGILGNAQGRSQEKKGTDSKAAPREKPVEFAPNVGRRGRPRKDDPNNGGLWTKDRNYRTSITFDKDTYAAVTEIAYNERLTVKEAIDRLLRLGMESYNKTGHFKGRVSNV